MPSECCDGGLVSPWDRVEGDEKVDYFNAVADPNCTEDEIRELTALVAGERGWELEDE